MCSEYFRPNLWPTTPDILPDFLQVGGRPAFMIRLVLAATLGASYGVYGPAFELCENDAFAPGSEEYLNSEKYELKHRDLNALRSLKEFIARINRIRQENPALQSDRNLRFHETDNPAAALLQQGDRRFFQHHHRHRESRFLSHADAAGCTGPEFARARCESRIPGS